MRPWKKILVVSMNEERASVLRFTLDVWGFAVTCAPSAAEAFDLVQAEKFEVLLCELPLVGIERLLELSREFDQGMRSLVLAGTVREFPVGINASAVIHKQDFSPAFLRERVRLLAARKRGPGLGIKPVASVSMPPIEEQISAA